MSNTVSRLIFLTVGLGIASCVHAIGNERLAATVDELKDALSQAEAGDAIVMKEGTWTDVDILFDRIGTSVRPVVLKAAVPGKTIITGRSRLRIGGEFLVVEGLYFENAFHDDDLISFRKNSKLAKYCRLTDCAIVNCNSPQPKASTRWVSLYGEHNRVDHCWMQGKTTEGATLVVWLNGTPNHHQIDHNFFGPRPELKKNGGETIRIGDSDTSLMTSGTVVELNRFEQCNGEAEIISNKSFENIYRSNLFLRCSGALTLRHGNDCEVAGNVFLGQGARGTGGVRIVGDNHLVVNNYFSELAGDDARAAICLMNGMENSPLSGYAPVRRATIAFNTLIHCKQNILVGLTDEDAGNDVLPEACEIVENLIVLKKGRTILDMKHKPVGLLVAGNRVHGLASALPDGFASAMVQFSKDEWGVMRLAEPLPSDARPEDWPSDDFDGQPRGHIKHVGCDQVLPGMAIPAALAAKTGPQWRQ